MSSGYACKESDAEKMEELISKILGMEERKKVFKQQGLSDDDIRKIIHMEKVVVGMECGSVNVPTDRTHM